MKNGLNVQRCQNCEEVYFPHRLLCAKCGSDKFALEEAHEAIMEESTMVRQARGRPDWVPHPIGTVRLLNGPPIIVGLDELIPHGARVKLFTHEGAPFARFLPST
jgi:uncharacterized OB-fold protein